MRHFTAALMLGMGMLALLAGRPGRSLQAPARDSDQTRALTLEFGIKDGAAARWDGSVSLSTGRIVKLRGHHFTDKDKINEGQSWQAATTDWPIPSGGMHPNEM